MSSVLDKFWSVPFREAATSVYTIIALTVVVGYLIYTQTRFTRDTYDEQDYRDAGHATLLEPLTGLSLTKEKLALFNCKNPQGRYLVALHSVIYDVSNVYEDFGPKGHYAAWSGNELSEIITAQAIRKKLDVEQHMRKWQQVLENCFFVAGRLDDYEQTEGNAGGDATAAATGSSTVAADDANSESSVDSVYWEDNNDATVIPKH